jgi:hypothetical protein
MQLFLKRLLFFLAVGLFLGVNAYAGTGDTLGLSSTWTKVSAWFTDGYVMKIISFLMLIFAITLVTMKQYLYAIVILIVLVVISNLPSVINAFAGATF